VLVDTLVDAAGTRFAWLVSQSEEPVRVEIETTGGLRLEDVETHEQLGTEVELPPYGVRVCRLIS
jgi:hypothetical protein